MQNAGLKGFRDISNVEGMLTQDEAEYLYHLAQANPGKGVIAEIGSWKGKSTVCLAWGSTAVDGEKIYAVDPHRPLADEGYFEDTEAEFLRNLAETGVTDQVVPMVMSSEDAVRDWNRPIRLLWIDGDHRYEQVKRDFLLWEPHVIDGGIIAMHDTIRKKGPKKVLWECIFLSDRFKAISIIDNITAAKKVRKISFWERLMKWLVIACRALYIFARKLRVPYAKPAGRWFLRTMTT